MATEILEKIGYFSDKDIQLFEKSLSKRVVQKGEILLKQGQICQTVYFISKGAFLEYNFKDEIEQNIIDLYIENEWLLNKQSFVRQEPSETIIEAFSESVIFKLDIHSIHNLIANSPAFLQLGSILEPAHSRIQFFDNSLSPLQKYQYLLENRREIVQAFPLKIIASYLKITPETLSRVREKITKGLS
ncbi:cyclic nucleotide-binding protein [Emticicia aquatilis]|uniref:Cyclic nucleotide-binding protein n=1 Tax=Emticicia aquatilis TaxID=1537369 RepID=A0A916Z1G0_9BACT|nr:Crp/Fnr family transcriptional regulator [Emticicia aquatilis]GGD71073.1 cyclic nucleotide-binding protein [Emticicia aquatilis]